MRIDYVGDEHEPVVIIDNFAPDPERWIEDAARSRLEVVGEFYPGLRARAPVAYFDGLKPVLARVAREVFGHASGIKLVRALYSVATSHSGQLTLPQRIPHVDDLATGALAVVHYLSREDFGGTAFYRHRSTGFETIDASRHASYMSALMADFATHGEPAPAYIDADTPIFERIARYDCVFNRALVYRSRLLHCGTLPNGFDLPADPRTGRLTVASFLARA